MPWNPSVIFIKLVQDRPAPTPWAPPGRGPWCGSWTVLYQFYKYHGWISWHSPLLRFSSELYHSGRKRATPIKHRAPNKKAAVHRRAAALPLYFIMYIAVLHEENWFHYIGLLKIHYYPFQKNARQKINELCINFLLTFTLDSVKIPYYNPNVF